MIGKMIKLSIIFSCFMAILLSPLYAGGKSEQEQETIKLTVWWWGEQEAPGAEEWFKESAEMFHQENPKITVECVLQSTEGLQPAISAAIEAGQGPDIVGNWAGVDTYDMMIKQQILPLDDLLTSEVIENTLLKFMVSFEGKLYAIPFYRGTHGLIYNKEHFREAGLNIPWEPESWDDILYAMERLKMIGVVPFSAGFKDWFGDWWYGPLGAQYLDSVDDMRKLFTGEASFEEPKYWKWLESLEDMANKGYFNEDAGGLDAYTGTVGIFGSGQSGIASVPDTLLTTFEKDMGEDAFGFIPFPTIGDGKLKNALPFWSASAFAIPSYVPHPKEAAAFLSFIRSPERLNAFYEKTGQFPADKRVDPASLTTPYSKTVMDMRINLHEMEPTFWTDFLLPRAVQEQGVFPATNRVALGEITPQEGGRMIQEAMEKLLKANPDMAQKWAGLLK